LGLSLVAWAGLGQSPIETDGDQYKVVMENEQVRALQYRDLPGEKTQQHRHLAFVVCAVLPFKRKIHLPGGLGRSQRGQQLPQHCQAHRPDPV
jgi:hypothetical protein